MDAIGQDLGKVLDQVGDIVAIAAPAPTTELTGDDVVAALDHAPQIRELRLDGLALGPELAQTRDRKIGDLGKEVIGEDPIKLGIHGLLQGQVAGGAIRPTVVRRLER